jgi:large subunit ribosomal protein L40
VYKAIKKIVRNRTVHETIERAWLLHKRHIRKAREEEITRKYNCMKHAMEVLEEVAPNLAWEANKPLDHTSRTPEEMRLANTLKGAARRVLDARLPGMFPREFRAPTDTPPTAGWNHSWTAPSSDDDGKKRKRK